MPPARRPLDNQPGSLVALLRLALGLLLAACAAPGAPAPGPLDEARAWGETVRSYRYERVTLVTQPDGATTIVNETGEVIPPDRQRMTVRGEARSDTPGNEIIIVGNQAWTRPLGFWPVWTPAQAGDLPPDPLAIALGALATAEGLTDAGQRVMEDGRRCQGWSFQFDPRGVPRWPAIAGGSAIEAESVLWVEPGGRLCGQTVRVARPGQPAAEYTAVLRDFDTPLAIQAPANE